MTASEGAADGVAATHARLLEAAAEMFREKGFAGTTTRELAATVGIHNASMYYHVRSKDDLLFTLCMDSLDRISGAVSSALEEADTPLAKIRVLIRAHLETSLADRGKHASMLMELRSLSLERRAIVITRRQEYEDVVEAVLRTGQQDRVIRSDMPARLLALGLLNLLNWTIFWFQPNGRLTSTEIAEVFTNLFLDGAAVRDDAGGPARKSGGPRTSPAKAKRAK